MAQRSLCMLTLVFAMFIACILPMALNASAEGNVKDVRLHITGSDVLSTNKVSYYTATLVDPQEREWEYEMWVSADNETGASPTADSPATGNITRGNWTFQFNLTSQSIPGDLTIHINCTSTTGSFWYMKEETITVVEPVIISATIQNPTNTDVKNATVYFFVDGVEIGSQTIGSINSHQSMDVNGEWISADKEPGWHDSEVMVDLNGDGIIDKSTGDMIITNRFYIEGESSWLTWLVVAFGLLALVAGLTFISKRKVR